MDPEWVENLNSVLDDNMLLTLPNGERLGIPSNVRWQSGGERGRRRGEEEEDMGGRGGGKMKK